MKFRGVVIAGLVALAFGLPLMISAFAGIGVSPVLSNSMQPALNAGDLVFTTKVPASQLQSGDLVSSSGLNAEADFIHRVIDIERFKTASWIQTRGDANPVADPRRHLAQNVSRVSVAIGSVPYLGNLLVFGATPQGQFSSLGVVGLGAAAYLALSINLGKRETETLLKNQNKEIQ